MGSVDNILRPGQNWLSETIEKLNRGNWLYKLATFITFKKWTFGEYYVFLVELNKKALGEEEAKRLAIEKVIEVYKYQNNKYPDEIKDFINDK